MAKTKNILLTRHAMVRMGERKIPRAWIERVARSPLWTEPDPLHDGVERRFGRVDEFGGRILRVACAETETEIRIITITFDRNARKDR